MDWILANWFWILIAGLFIVMHLFGHGGHGGHGGGNQQGNENANVGNETQPRPANTGAGGHQH